MTQERFTQLPTVITSELSDIICAVQGFVSEPLALGLSTQQTLGQIYNLLKSNILLFHAGNPNGVVTGTPPQLCYDTVNGVLYVNSVLGTTWNKSITLTAGPGITIVQNGDVIEISGSAGPGITWNDIVVVNPPAMVSNNGYKANNVSRVFLPLPAASVFGDEIKIAGFNTGGWRISQGGGQQIIVGSTKSTLGAGGYVESTNEFDSITLVCMSDNLSWQAVGAPQGNLTII